MALKHLLDLNKTDRYTADGRDKINELQAKVTEDVSYKPGDISQKTGLQKQPDGSWAPPKKGNKTAGRNLGTKRVERGPGAIHTPGKGSVGLEQMKEAAEAGLKGEALKEFMLGKKSESKPAGLEAQRKLWNAGYKFNVEPSQGLGWESKGNYSIHSVTSPEGKKMSMEEALTELEAKNKPDAAEQRDQIGAEIKESLEAAKYYYQKAQSFSPTDPSYKTYMAKAKQYNDEAKAQADDYGFEFEEMHNSGITNAVNKYAEEQSKPATRKSVDKEKLLDALSFDLVDTTADIEEEYNAIEHSDNSRLPEFVRQEIERDYVNKTNGEKWTDEEKDIIAEEVTRRIKQRQSKDAAPRELTGDCKIKIRQTQDVKYNTGDISQKTGLQKQPDGSWAPPKKGGKPAAKKEAGEKTDKVGEFMKAYERGDFGKYQQNAEQKKAESFFKQNKPKTYTSKEGRRNFRAALEDNPKDAYDFSKTVEHSIPMSAGDKEQLANIKSFMQDENTDYKDAIKSVATGLVNGNQMRGDWYPEKEQSVLKIAKSVGLEKEVMNYIKANHKGYEFGYSEDAAPKIRELTGDCKIRVRKA